MFSTRMLTLALAMLVAAPAALADEPGAMSVTFLRGDATARQREGAPAALAEGTALHEGDLIETGANGRLELLLGTGSMVRLGPKSRLELTSAATDASSFRARLSFGNLWAKVHKLIGGQKFLIETQNGVAGVRGTEFRVAAYSGGQMVRVYQGAVEVKSHDGKWTHLVKPGAEIRYSKSASLGPRPFEAKKERSSFMRWVRRKGMEAGPERGQQHEPRSKEKGHPKRR